MTNLYRIPIAIMGVKMQLSTKQIAGMRELDAYFLQGTSSKDDSFVYMSGSFCYFSLLNPLKLSLLEKAPKAV